jgi:uncharacterized protein
LRILITGATGFIGQPLCRHLADGGHEVATVSRDPIAASARLGPGITAHGGIAAAWAACTGIPYDAVINLAGAPIAEGRWTPERKRILYTSRINLTRELVEMIRRTPAKPAVLISASASGYYGDAGDRELDESAPAGGGFLAELCRDWEQTALAAGAAGVRVCIVRLGLVLGPGGGLLARLAPLFRAGLGGRLGSGRQWMPWIHQRDVIGLIVHLLRRDDLAGAFNVSAPKPVTNAEFTRALARAVHRPALMPVPAAALRVALGEMGGMLTASQRMVARRALESGYEFAFRELTGALGDGVR